MNRISERLSAVWTTVKCPGCGKQVPLADSPGSTPTSQSVSKPGKRWSFIWVAPSGPVCPECAFPLARYLRRLLWIRLFLGGVGALTLSGFLFVLSWVGGSRTWITWTVTIVGLLGAVALLAGLAGLVIGGRRSPTDSGSGL